jgi:hypothetical protein
MAWAFLTIHFPAFRYNLPAGRSFSFCSFDKLRMTKRKRISTAIGAKKQTN